MKIQIESTTKVIDLKTETGTVPARVWEGTTESGIPIFCFITRIAVSNGQDHTEFERELPRYLAQS